MTPATDETRERTPLSPPARGARPTLAPAARAPEPRRPAGSDLGRMMRGVGEDVRDYQRLEALLEEQFAAALRHQSTPLADLARQVMGLVDGLEARRRERVALVASLAGADATMTAAFALLAGPQRAAVESGWQALEQLARRCKQLNVRNCQLLMNQHDTMQRVLRGDEATYAPA